MDYPTFKNKVGELTGIDLSHYKSQQMDRRINGLMQVWNIPTYDQFYEVLQKDPKRYKEFVKKLTINVSEFFRNAERFMDLWHKIIPEMLAKGSPISIWSAGCSDGAEAYSVAIIARELGAEKRIKILGTDVDLEILARAQEAVFGPQEVKSLPEELTLKYFDIKDKLFVLKDSIKRLVEFRAHNLLVDAYPANMDLIICRNVVIYFTDAAKSILYQNFQKALKPGGYLMVGGTEPLLYYRQLGFENPSISFYQKVG